MPTTTEPTDVLSIEDAMLATRDPTSTANTNSDRVARVNSNVSRLLDQIAGPVIRRAIVDEEQPGGRHHIWVDQWPIASVQTLTEYDNTGTALVLARETYQTKPADGYRLHRYSLTATSPPHVTSDPTPVTEWPHSGRIERRAGGWPQRFTQGTVVASYTAGRYPTVDDVPAFWKQAAVLLVKWVWRTEQPAVAILGDYEVPASNFPTFAVPRAVVDHLGPEYRSER